MVIIWGANFSVIKYALREFSPIAFNVLRLVLASAVFLIAIAMATERPRRDRPPDPPLTSAEWTRIVILGVIGHFFYQLAFLAGVARTSVSNSALIFGTTPVAVALLASISGHERVPVARWVGAALSVAGIYIIVGHAATIGGRTLVGDFLVFCGMFCWSIYSVLAQPLLRRRSLLIVTGYSMTIGAVLFAIVSVPWLVSTDWRTISAGSWLAMMLSSLLALAFSYMIWYTAVQRIGSSRTALYSNLTPVVAMVVAALWLGEHITAIQIAGAATILAGLFVARLGPTASQA